MHWTERDSLHHHSNYRAFLLHYWVSRSSASLGRPQRRERERTRPVSPRWWALRWQPPPYIKGPLTALRGDCLSTALHEELEAVSRSGEHALPTKWERRPECTCQGRETHLKSGRSTRSQQLHLRRRHADGRFPQEHPVRAEAGYTEHTVPAAPSHTTAKFFSPSYFYTTLLPAK